ncbi:cache domain-containing protein [Limibacter armeniacum]|uniref:sensor histidine kinase n=1 Tax=Limibacter armeniacum TaxID=466084 RepID=UPI002FE5B4B7
MSIDRGNKKGETLTRAVFIPVISLVSIAILLIVGMWSINEIRNFQHETGQLQYDLVERQKKLVKEEVDNTIAYIKDQQKRNIEYLRAVLQKRVEIAYNLVDNVYKEYHGKKSDDELRNIVKTSLSSVQFSEGRGYYVLARTSKEIILNKTIPELNETSTFKVHTKEGLALIDEMIRIGKEKGEGFHSYLWKKPNSAPDKVFPKYSFVKYFEPLDLLIITGEYLDDVQHDLKHSILERLASISFGDDGYIFVHEGNHSILQENRVLINNPIDISNFVVFDDHGNETLIADTKSLSKGSFYYYKYQRPKQKELVNKISYINIFPEWNWVVGAGVYTDVLDVAIAEKKKELNNNVSKDIIKIVLVAIALIAVLWWQIKRVTDNVSRSLNEFARFFEKASKDHVKIDEERLFYDDFRSLSQMANKMLSEREKDKQELQYAYNEIQTSEEELRQQSESLQMTNEHLHQVLKDLKQTQAQLINSEKMASLGQLTAGIAHEINNPINFVSSNITPLKEDMDDLIQLINRVKALDSNGNINQQLADIESFSQKIELEVIIQELSDLIKGIEEGAERTKNIVQGLRNFSRMDEEDFKLADIHEGLESTLTILNNKIRKKNITVEKDYGDLPKIECLPGKLNQVFMNIVNNAIQALEDENGHIYISTLYNSRAQKVCIRFKDNGQGIPRSILDKVFEPFFTTKDVGEGTGLGLSISYGIVQQHHGIIAVESQLRTTENPNSYTVFEIMLPVTQPK